MFDKVVKNTVTNQVIEQVKGLLIDGVLRPGDKLPPERQMAEQLGVSRPSLREALRALEYAGVLEPQSGGGVCVANESAVLENNLHTAHLIRQFALEEMIEARKVIESAAVRFAIQRGTDEGLESVRAEHELCRKALGDKQTFVLADYAFHRAIAEAGGNGIMTAMMSSMRSMMSHFNIELLSTRKGREEVVLHHEDILAGLEKRDLAATMAAMEDHLENVVHTMKLKKPSGE